MANIINASTSSGLVQTADTSGTIELQSSGGTKLSVTSAGTSISQYTPATSLITSGTAIASTSGTSIDFTGIPSWVKRVTVMFSGVSTNGTSNTLVQIGDSGGIENTGYTSGVTQSNNTTLTSSTAGFIVSSGQTTGSAYSGLVNIALMGSNQWAVSGVLLNSIAVTHPFAGNKTLSDTLDRIRITTVNGTDTFDAGSINILYE